MTVATDPRKTGIAVPVQILAQTATAASVTGTTTETVVATVAVPAGLMGASGALRVSYLTSQTNNANVKTLSVKLGATLFVAQALASVGSVSSLLVIRNRTAASQVAWVAAGAGVGNSAGNGQATGTENTANALSLTVTITLASGTDTATLEALTVEFLPGV